MQRLPRSLTIALSSGFVAVFAAALPLIAPGAQQQLQYTRSTRVDLPGIMRMFGGGRAENETTTISATRQRTDKTNGTSDIVQCDLKRVIHLDNNAKTYSILTFDQMRAAMQAAMSRMPRSTPQHGTSTTGPTIQGSGSFTLSVNTVNDPQTQTLFGMTAHHVVETITGTSNGTGQCPSGSLSMTTDEWYVPKVMNFSCPMPRPQLPVMPAVAAPRGNPMANPCFGRFQIEASGKKASSNRFALKQTSTMDMGGFKLTTHDDVTQYQVMPYNPSFFRAPAGYTQVSPPPMMGR